MNDYLAKPVVLNALNKKLNKWLKKAGKSSQKQQQTIAKDDSFYIDMDKLEEFVGSDKKLQCIFLDKFIKDTEKLLSTVDKNNAKSIQDMAHQAKTSANAVGSAQLADAFLQLESAALSKAPENLDTLLKTCVELFEHAQAEIASILKTDEVN